MQRKEQPEKPLKGFVLPNESYKWDFILEKYGDEQQETTSERSVAACLRGLLLDMRQPYVCRATD